MICDKGQFSLKVLTQPGTCQSCPSDKAVCNGGSDIGPLLGYWRSSNLSENFIKCLSKNSCLGMVAPDNNP